MSLIDTLMRTAAGTLDLAVAALLLRDLSRSPLAWIGALFAAGVASYQVCSSPDFRDFPHFWQAPFLIICIANPLLFWLFARALFDDTFRPRPGHALIAIALLATGFSRWLGLFGDAGIPFMTSVVLQQMLVFGLALHALFVAYAGRADDLVEPRRRFRLAFVAATSGYISVLVLAELVLKSGRAPLPIDTLNAAAILVITAIVCGRLTALRPDILAVPPANGAEAGPPRARSRLTRTEPADAALLERLDEFMTQEVWRESGLTIAGLAARLGTTEARLRHTINRGLGFRNFNAFLNHYRISAARAELADPAKGRLPVLTIAMDLGYGSIGPFNRAFKQDTGMTPTAYRQEKLGGCAP